MSKRNIGKITDTQTTDVNFIRQLIDAVQNGNPDSVKYFDDSNLSLMVDNFQIDVSQTDVFYYDGFWKRFFGIGEWGFKPGELERYSLSVTENNIPLRWQDCSQISESYKLNPDGAWRKNYNVAFMSAAMASDKGIYCKPHSCIMYPDSMCYKQNKHLFEPLKELWTVATLKFPTAKVIHNTNATHETRYNLPAVKNAKDLDLLRKRVLDALYRNKAK